MKKLNKKGFTLIELMIVIAIIAILAAILVPNFVKARAQGQLTACKSNLKNIGTAEEMFAADHNGRYTGTLRYLQDGSQNYMRVIPTCPLVPASDYTYAAIKNPDFYYVECTTGNHMQAGTAAVKYPQFDSSIGLICPLKDEDSDIARNSYDPQSVMTSLGGVAATDSN